MDSEYRVQITETLLASGRLLDHGDYAGYLSLFCEDGEYQIITHAPEIADNTTWMDLTKTELQNLLDSAPRHIWNTGLRTRHIAAPSFKVSETHINTSATVSVYRTDQEGITSIYAVGVYRDQWQPTSEGWRLRKRILELATRNLTPPSAMPI